MLETGDPRYDQNIWGPGGSVQGKRTYSRTKVDQGALTAALAAAAGGAAEVLGVEFGDFEAESRAWLEGMVEGEWGSGRDQFTVMKGMWFGIWRVHEMFRESGVAAADIVVRTRWDAVFVKPLGIRAQNIDVHGAECVRVTVEVPGYPPSAVTCQDGALVTPDAVLKMLLMGHRRRLRGPYGEQMRNHDRCEAGDRRCRGVVAVPDHRGRLPLRWSPGANRGVLRDVRAAGLLPRHDVATEGGDRVGVDRADQRGGEARRAAAHRAVLP